MTNKPDQRTANLVHFPNKDATDPRALDEFLDDFDGVLNVGADNTLAGAINVYGSDTTGGSVKIYQDGDRDGTVDYWELFCGPDDERFHIRGEGETVDDLAIESGGTVRLAMRFGLVYIGQDDDTPGLLRLYGGGTGENGGRVRLYHDADSDGAGNEYFEIISESGGITIERSDGTESIKIASSGAVSLPQHPNQLIVTGDSGAIQSWTGIPTSVTGSRAGATTYQNTSGVPMFVNIVGLAAALRNVQVSSDNFVSSTITVGVINTIRDAISFWVPDNWYYRVNGTMTIDHWSEVTS